MPIVGKTDKYELGAGLPRLAKIFKGDAKTGNRPGADLGNQFRIVFDAPYARLEDPFNEMYGSRPSMIKRCVLLGGTPEEVFPNWMEEWAKSGLIHRCDGQVQHAWLNRQTGRIDKTPTPCTQCNCKQVGRLNILLPDFTLKTNQLGFFQLETHSISDIMHIHSLLATVMQLRGGSLSGAMLTLMRQEKEISSPELRDGKPTGNQTKKKHWLIHLRMDETFTQQAVGRLGDGIDLSTGELPAPSQPALPAPVVAEDIVEGELVHPAEVPAKQPQPEAPKKALGAADFDTMQSKFTKEIANDFANYWASKDITADTILIVLGVERISAWDKTVSDAHGKLVEYTTKHDSIAPADEIPFIEPTEAELSEMGGKQSPFKKAS